MQLDGVSELLGGGVRVAVGERRLADRLRQRGERVGVPGLGGDPRERLGAGVRAAHGPRCRAKKAAPQRRPLTA